MSTQIFSPLPVQKAGKRDAPKLFRVHKFKITHLNLCVRYLLRIYKYINYVFRQKQKKLFFITYI